jgi:hypothetical protein
VSSVAPTLKAVREHAARLREVQAALDPATGPSAERRRWFDALAVALAASGDSLCEHTARTMTSFAAGLFAGGDAEALPVDNLDLERAFRLPKGHERRIHGHAHAGVRIVQRGPTLLLTLAAHARHADPFCAADLIPWRDAQPPTTQLQSARRRRLMRLARSSKKRSPLLAELERRYRRAVQAT